MYRGWYKVAFERELGGDITAAKIGDLPLILVRTRDGVRAFDAACPHRGAHLAHGGKLDGNVIVCPFHGNRVRLGEEEDAGCGFRLQGYRTLAVGGLVFVLLDERRDNGFGALLQALDADHFFVQGFAIDIRTPPEMVVENGFDGAHFKYVHGLDRVPDLRLVAGRDGEMVVEAVFRTPANLSWLEGESGAPAEFGFAASVFSPNLCVTRLARAGQEYRVISGVTPNGDGSCTVRVSLAIPAGPDGAAPDPQSVRALLRDSKLAYEQDKAVWEHLVPGAPQRFTPADELVVAYRDYCRRFLEELPA
jgi:phenylpropionate dioxygenase-like ring-hydroxylating dioxygenase large terminal subunit